MAGNLSANDVLLLVNRVSSTLRWPGKQPALQRILEDLWILPGVLDLFRETPQCPIILPRPGHEITR